MNIFSTTEVCVKVSNNGISLAYLQVVINVILHTKATLETVFMLRMFFCNCRDFWLEFKKEF